MHVAMDADCLIKLTKAGLKERICRSWTVSVPELVRVETVDRVPGLPDARAIRENVDAGLVQVVAQTEHALSGEEAVLRLFRTHGLDAVATDDTRFIRRLRSLGVPYAVPGVVVVLLLRERALSVDEARSALAALRPHISSDEHTVAQLALGQGG